MRKKPKTIPRKVVMIAIRAYQKTLSFDHGPMSHLYPYGFCRFHPSCSEYSYQAVERFGLFKGGWLATKRICRCNPYNKGGHDPVPGKGRKQKTENRKRITNHASCSSFPNP